MPDPSDTFEHRLKQTLDSLLAPPPFDAQRDREILAAARIAYWAQASTRRWRWGGWSAAGIAAAVALAAGITWHQLSSHSPTSSSISYTRTGDIRDAFYLARQLKSHSKPPSDWDINHDGTIDQSDVNALALAAVKVTP